MWWVVAQYVVLLIDLWFGYEALQLSHFQGSGCFPSALICILQGRVLSLPMALSTISKGLVVVVILPFECVVVEGNFELSCFCSLLSTVSGIKGA